MRRVAVLYGGISAERAVSLSSGRGVIAALRAQNFAVTPIEAGQDLGAVIRALEDARPDVVFNALHGRFGEDGVIQGVLDWMGLAYTHSPARASALAMDKAASRAIFAAHGIAIPPGHVIEIATLAERDPLPRPYVVKPLNEGSSVGVTIVREGDNRRAAIAAEWRFGNFALAERFIPGRELTVGVLGGRALGVTEILAAHEFYDYDSKYAEGGSRHILPAAVAASVAGEAERMALEAHAALGCRGATRADFRFDDTNGTKSLYLLEVNTQPGLTPTSLLPEQAARQGMDYGALCAWMVEDALCRA